MKSFIVDKLFWSYRMNMVVDVGGVEMLDVGFPFCVASVFEL